MKIREFQHQPVQPDTYEASMALQQLMRIAKCGMKLHNMIDNDAEMESWVAKKIDLAGDYVKKVYNYTEGEKAGLYDDGGMTEDAGDQDDWTKLLNAVAQRYGKEKARVIHDYVQYGTDSGPELMKDYGLTPGDGMEENQREWFKKFPWLEKLDKTSWMDRLINIAGEGPEYGGAEYKYPKGLESVSEDEDKKTVIHSITPGSEKEKGMMQAAIFQGGKRTNVLAATPKDLANQYIKNGVNYNDFNFLHTSDVDFPEEDDGWNNEKYGNDAHGFIQDALKILKNYKGESVSEDAGEGHMSKSTLYHTVKYAIALMQMIKKGDDLEGWVQSKLNKAADYLQGAANYEEYQKLNPYREELDPTLMQKHAEVIQRNIDEILDKETKLDDIDTKPGMMRILAKRVNEVEKEIAKENRKNTDEAHGGQHTTSGRSMTKGEMNKREKIVKGMKKDKAGFKKRYGKDAEAVMYATATKQAMEDGHTDVPSAIRNCETIIEDAIQMKQKLQTMEGELPSWMTQMIAVAASDLNDARDYLLNPTTESGIMYRAGVKKYGKAGMKAIQSAAGKGASHQEIGKIKDKYLKDAEDLEEGLKDWAKGLAMAGVLVAGMAGVGSIQDAIDRSVPAVQAMETALEMAKDAGNDELAAMIEKDLSAVKIRLSSGKDLGFVKGMQDKYGKFVKTEGLSYENTLRVNLESKIRSLK